MAEINNNVYFPTKLSPEQFLYFAVDNTDLKIDTPDGKNQLHGTVIVAYQNQEHPKRNFTPLKIDRKQRRGVNSFKEPLYKVIHCSQSTRKNMKSYLSSLLNYTVTTILHGVFSNH